VDRWSRGSSPLHRRDPRAKLAALLVFLVAIATATQGIAILAGALFLLLAAALLWARVPLTGAVARAALVLPFTAAFALVCWLAGDPARGVALLLKSYLSALAVLTVVATTPLPALLQALEFARAPRFLLMVGQFLYRYLFVISEEAQHMAKAAAARGATAGGLTENRHRFRGAAGALAVLFARSYGRAGDIHRAMLARGFSGRLPALDTFRFRTADAIFLTLATLLPVLLRIAAARIA
jgi:cobalt/nickel transport system permease protein